ncbi:MAG: hypothetical protein ACO1SV_27310 [Fimbriimonas sp.]
MRSSTRFLSLLFVFILALLQIGCGGGGGGGGSSPTPVAATYSVEWAARSRTAGPSSALSVVFTLRNAQNQTVVTDTRSRNTNPAAYTGTYTTAQRVAPGNYTATFTFHAGTNGTGDVVGTGSQAVTLGTNGEIPSIQTQGTIATVTVAADQEVRVGETTTLTFTARTANGTALALTPGSAFWTVTSGGDLLEVAQGGGALIGLALGTAEVRVTVDGVASAPVAVEITESGTPVSIQAPGRTLLWAAAQNGTNAWFQVEVNGDQANTRISDENGRYGLAAAFVDETGQVAVEVMQATLAETNVFRIAPPFAFPEETTVAGTLSNLDPGQAVSVFGYELSDFLEANGAYSASVGSRNPWDLVAIVRDAGDMPIAAAVRRGLAQGPNTGVNLNVDTDFLPLGTYTLTAQGSNIDSLTLFTELTTPNRTKATMGIASENPLTYHSLHPTLQAAGDRYTFFANTFADNWFNQTSLTRATPGNVTLATTAPLGQPTVTREGIGEGTRGRVQWPTLADAKLYEIVLTGNNSTFRTFLTPGWLGAGATRTYLSADFFEVSGWNSEWSLGEFNDWSVRAYGNNGNLADLFDANAPLRDGYQWSTWDRFGSLGGDLLRRPTKGRREGLPGAPIRRNR